MKNKKINFPVKLIIFLLIILLAFSFIIGYIWKALSSSDFFVVKQVVVRNSDSSFDYLKGKNIFALDLNLEAHRAALHCSDCRKIRFARILPNCLFIDFLKRKPQALVKFYKDFAIDEQGVLFYPTAAIQAQGLPIIYGLETKIFAPKPGTKYKKVELELALAILKEFNANKSFLGFSLKRIDVANLESASFFILLPRQLVDFTRTRPQVEWMGFEVRTGASNIREKMLILGGLVMQMRKEWLNIKYIDLRFKEPLIKLNNVK
ncbi:MAG: cell division protein FtsQ/DivIB [Candidatus Omnitrophota bacterium]